MWKYKLSKYPSFIPCTKCRISLKKYPKYVHFNIFSFPSWNNFSKKAEMKSRCNHRRNFKFIHTLSDAFGMNNLKVYSSFIHAQSSAFVSQCPQCCRVLYISIHNVKFNFFQVGTSMPHSVLLPLTLPFP